MRPLFVIAREIRATWPKPYFGAAPYINAMAALETLTDKYGMEDGKTVIQYFLVNAGRWHGADARRIKAELQSMIG